MGTTKKMKCQGLYFDIEVPFEEGHACTAGEAGALNQLFIENNRNNFASTVKEAKKVAEAQGTDVDMADLQAQLTERAEGYKFGVLTRAIREADPVASRARKVARTYAVKYWQAQNPGQKVKECPKEWLEQSIESLLSSEEYGPKIQEAAEKLWQAEQGVQELEIPME